MYNVFGSANMAVHNSKKNVYLSLNSMEFPEYFFVKGSNYLGGFIPELWVSPGP